MLGGNRTAVEGRPDSSAGAPVYQLRHGNKYAKGRNGGLFGGNATLREQDEN
jgi:hypothetical protein